MRLQRGRGQGKVCTSLRRRGKTRLADTDGVVDRDTFLFMTAYIDERERTDAEKGQNPFTSRHMFAKGVDGLPTIY